MTDLQRLILHLRANHRCLFLSTTEEREALDLLAHAALELGWPSLRWSAAYGLRDAALVEAFHAKTALTTDRLEAALRHWGQSRCVPAD